MILGVLFLVSCSQSGSSYKDAAQLRGGETRPTLSPMNFYGPTARAYAAAREIPEVIDSIHCYCECKKHLGHKSLLTCYVNEHAAYCDICINEALMAKQMHDKGMDVVSIRKAIDSKYARM
jgi:hypothetical protein